MSKLYCGIVCWDDFFAYSKPKNYISVVYNAGCSNIENAKISFNNQESGAFQTHFALPYMKPKCIVSGIISSDYFKEENTICRFCWQLW